MKSQLPQAPSFTVLCYADLLCRLVASLYKAGCDSSEVVGANY